MSRNADESAFGAVLGRLGESLAPQLLARLGLTDVRDLNSVKKHFPWADFAGILNGRWVVAAVRTRICWQKPRNPERAGRNTKFGRPGPRKARLAASLFRKLNGLDPATPVDHLWIAIAVDIDNTYDAYWGRLDEMGEVTSRSGDHGLYIRMGDKDIERYASSGRQLAKREPIEIPWEDYPGEWASVARRHYLDIPEALGRESRIRTAVLRCAETMTNANRLPPAGSQSIAVPAIGLLSASPKKARAVPAKTRPEPGVPERGQTLEKALVACTNKAVAGFVQERIGDPTQSRIDRALRYPVLNHQGASQVGWYVSLFSRRARVRQHGRFQSDAQFWEVLLSEPDIRELDGGRHLGFYLTTSDDCRLFQAFVSSRGATIRMS